MSLDRTSPSSLGSSPALALGRPGNQIMCDHRYITCTCSVTDIHLRIYVQYMYNSVCMYKCFYTDITIVLIHSVPLLSVRYLGNIFSTLSL